MKISAQLPEFPNSDRVTAIHVGLEAFPFHRVAKELGDIPQEMANDERCAETAPTGLDWKRIAGIAALVVAAPVFLWVRGGGRA